MRKSKPPQTSIDAYKSLDPAKINETYKMIISALAVIKSGSFEDISKHLKVEKSVVWKRLGEMEKMKLLQRPGTKKKLKSGRDGYVWEISNEYYEICMTIATQYNLKDKPTIQDHSRNIKAISESKPVQTNKLF